VPTNTAQTAIQVLSDAGIAEANRWNSTKLMSKLVFAIVKIKYDQEKGITGLADITAVINNSLTKPGAVIKDYLTNARYGAGLSLGKVDTTALTATARPIASHNAASTQAVATSPSRRSRRMSHVTGRVSSQHRSMAQASMPIRRGAISVSMIRQMSKRLASSSPAYASPTMPLAV
jgi:hypothetical protein